MSKTLLFIGDAFEDIYHTGYFVDSKVDHYTKRWINCSTFIYDGGITYVLNNVDRYLDSDFDYDIICNHKPIPMIRYHFGKETVLVPGDYSNLFLEVDALGFGEDSPLKYEGIVIADYNRGTVQKIFGPDYAYAWKKVSSNWVIVDSKYRSFTPEMKAKIRSKCFILKINKDEYTEEYAKSMDFDVVILTDAEKPCSVWFKQSGMSCTFAVDHIEVVSTCGAGDVFSAILAGYLYKTIGPIEQRILAAIPKCIEYSQIVCGLPHTSYIPLIEED